MKLWTKQEHSAIPRSATERAMFLICSYFDYQYKFKISNEQLLKWLSLFLLLFCHFNNEFPSLFLYLCHLK